MIIFSTMKSDLNSPASGTYQRL